MDKKNSALSAKQMGEFKKILIQEKERLEEELKEIKEGILKTSQSESTGENVYEDNYADSGTATFERERDLSLGRNIEDILERVNSSLNRIKKGTYGICSHCANTIPVQRLEALPYADLCIKCKRKEEKIR